MELRWPTYKRRSDPINSPKNRKKANLLSTTIASPVSGRKTDEYFDDNCTQFFRSLQTQLVRQPSTSAQNETDAPKQTVEEANSSAYNFTQTGLSQLLASSQFEESLTSGQRIRPTQAATEYENSQVVTQIPRPPEVNADVAVPGNDHDEKDDDNANLMQCSQVFLNEVTAWHLDISAMINESLNANRIGDIEESFDANKFNVHKRSATCSQYVQMKRPSADAVNRTLFNTTDDQLLAGFVAADGTGDADVGIIEAGANELVLNQADVSEELNEAIDLDSSALKALLDDVDDDVLNTSVAQAANNRRSNSFQRPSVTLRRDSDSFQRNQNNQANNPSRPVSSSSFGSMGSFFGLPEKVRKLIKEYKQIDDLYGELLLMQ